MTGKLALSVCAYCGFVIERQEDGTWGRGKIGGLKGLDTECDKAPVTDPDRMPPHQPGVVAEPPEENTSPVAFNPDLPPANIPKIPRMT